MVDDSPIIEAQLSGEDWTPQNYDLKFMGPMPLRRALYLSRNLATIRLGKELGEPSVIEMAKKFGITTTIPPYPSIHTARRVYPLGNARATRVRELGVRRRPCYPPRENQRGRVLVSEPREGQVMSAERRLMVEIMKDVISTARPTGRWGRASDSRGGIPAHKPATLWFIGYTMISSPGCDLARKPQKIKSKHRRGTRRAGVGVVHDRVIIAEGNRPTAAARRMSGKHRRSRAAAHPFCPSEVINTEFYIPCTEPLRDATTHAVRIDVGIRWQSHSVLRIGRYRNARAPGGMPVIVHRIRVPGSDPTNPFRLPPLDERRFVNRFRVWFSAKRGAGEIAFRSCTYW